MKKYFLLIIILISFFGSCRKDPYYDPNPVDEYFTGIVFLDCNGNVFQNKKVVLQRWFSGCFARGIVDSIIGFTDSDGRYLLKRKTPHSELQFTTTSYYYKLFIPGTNEEISYAKPGQYDFYPNDTNLNCIVHFHFNYQYPLTNKDTLYYQLIPINSDGSWSNELGSLQFITGPFHDTTLHLPLLHISGVFESESKKMVNAKIHFARLRKNNFISSDNYSSEFIDVTRQICSVSDSIECIVNH